MTVSVKKLQTRAVQAEGVSMDFERVFQEHWSRIYAVIYRIIGDPAEAEDLALETFLRLHQRPPRKETNTPGWLYRVATNLGLNALRAKKRRGFYETRAGIATLETALTTQPDRAVERAEDRLRVRQALSKMKKQPAKILILRYSGFSYAEIAGVVGVSSKSVGTLLARAEREFKRHYQVLEGGSHDWKPERKSN